MWQGLLNRRLPDPWRMPPESETTPDWREILQRRAVLRRWSWLMAVPMVLALLVPAIGGYLLGGLGAGQIVRLQAAAADRAARPSMPATPAAPFAPQRLPVPMPLSATPVRVVGSSLGPGQARVLSQTGLPIEFMLPTPGEWRCELYQAPGAGSATAYEWGCRVGEAGRLPQLQILVAACDPDCPAGRRAALRPYYLPEQLTPSDPSTWYAEATSDPDIFGSTGYELAMEHVWAAPAGVLREDSPPQDLYVAAVVQLPSGQEDEARQIINALRTRM